jgi:hypothetical protein
MIIFLFFPNGLAFQVSELAFAKSSFKKRLRAGMPDGLFSNQKFQSTRCFFFKLKIPICQMVYFRTKNSNLPDGLFSSQKFQSARWFIFKPKIPIW